MRFREEAVHRGGQRGERRVREQGAGATKEANGTEPTEPRRLICAQSGRAQRTKQTARKSTGGAAPRRLLATEGAASRAAASHAVGWPFGIGQRPDGGRFGSDPLLKIAFHMKETNMSLSYRSGAVKP